MMAQYLALKEQADEALLFYRMGDFFELFFEDAKAAAATLDIALTSRGERGGEPVPMCGVPVHSAESYLARLIRAGHRVAIAEQTETPDEAKARAKAEGTPVSKVLVARDIVRFVTPGTLTEDALLDPRAANRLAAIAPLREAVGIAVCDVSTGALTCEECTPEALDAVLARLSPSEVIGPEGWEGPTDVQHRPRAGFASDKGEAKLKAVFGLATLDGLGEFSRPMLAAAGGLLDYLDHVGRGTLPYLQPPKVESSDGRMAMDASTRASLEITVTQSGQRKGTLLACLDRCSTGAGSRLLAEDLAAPLTERPQIEMRAIGVARLHGDPLLRADLRNALRALPDIARALGRVVAGRGSPRDLGQIRDGLAGARSLAEQLAQASDLPPLLVEAASNLGGHSALIDTLMRALVPSPPTERAQGGYVASGYDHALDALRETSGNARRAIAALEAKYREDTGVATLKIKHNKVLGYFIEVPARHGDALMAPDSGFTHRQTMAGAVRFNSLGLHEEASRITQAGAHAQAAEEAHFEDLCGQIVEAREPIAATAQALARIDVTAGWAERAIVGEWCRPMLTDTPVLDVECGRHPVVEEALSASGDRFVANDCALDEDERVWLIGGPNMGGKSTFLRQNALIVLMAQAGGFVLATRATVGIADRLFSRVGASDNLARGQSTFMVEMVETAAILRQATRNSFVILDEVGRGTSTYDGMALAWAVVEAMHDRLECRTLFATHYHELSRMAERCDALSLRHVRAREWKGDLVLLHELAEGAADRSYGLDVARLAGVPKPVLGRAREVLAALEKGRAETGGLAAGLGDLPLFAAATQQAEPAKDGLREMLDGIDADALTPREALDLVYALKKRADDG